MPIELGYWKLRALGQPIRLYLEFLGEEYTEKRYDRTDSDEWAKTKLNMDMDFPNLPYLRDGDIKLTQSSAILRYLADKHNMLGSTVKERARICMLECTAVDLRFGLVRISLNPDFEKVKDEYLTNLPQTLRLWSKYLGSKPYLHYDKPCHVDFMVYEALDAIMYLAPKCLDDFSNLKQYVHRIQHLPAIEAYLKSDRFIKWPLHGWSAKFGGGDAPPS